MDQKKLYIKCETELDLSIGMYEVGIEKDEHRLKNNNNEAGTKFVSKSVSENEYKLFRKIN